MSEITAGKKLKWLRSAMWIVAFGSFGFTDGRRWVTVALFLLAVAVSWFVDRIEHSDEM